MKQVVIGVTAIMVGLATIAVFIGRTGAPAPAPVASGASSGVIYTASFPNMEGVPQSLGRWQQKLLVINFWATWCAPCKEEMPLLIKLQEKYRDRGLQIVGIAADSPENVANFSKKLAISYPVLADEAHAIEFSRRLGNRAGLLPHTVVVKAGGDVVLAQLGKISEAEFETVILNNLPK
jgi:thiol-disulfide isomerase/thioredoxin